MLINLTQQMHSNIWSTNPVSWLTSQLLLDSRSDNIPSEWSSLRQSRVHGGKSYH